MTDFTPAAASSTLEQRIRALEILLRDQQTQNQAITSDAALAQGEAPIISNLAIAKGVGAVRVTWDAAAGNVRRYLVQLADNVGFSSPIERQTVETFADFSPGEGVGDTTYYARVKAVLNNGIEGPYASTVNSTPGKAQTTDIASASITTALIQDLAVQEAKIDSLSVSSIKVQDNAITAPSGAFTAGSVSFSSETTVQSVSVTVDDASAPLFVWGFFEGLGGSSNTFKVRIKRDSTTILTGSDISVNTSNEIPFAYSVIETPGTGTFTYSLTVEPGSGSGHTATNRTLLVLSIKK